MDSNNETLACKRLDFSNAQIRCIIFHSERKVVKIGTVLNEDFCNKDQFLALGLLLLTFHSMGPLLNAIVNGHCT